MERLDPVRGLSREEVDHQDGNYIDVCIEDCFDNALSHGYVFILLHICSSRCLSSSHFPMLYVRAARKRACVYALLQVFSLSFSPINSHSESQDLLHHRFSPSILILVSPARVSCIDRARYNSLPTLSIMFRRGAAHIMLYFFVSVGLCLKDGCSCCSER